MERVGEEAVLKTCQQDVPERDSPSGPAVHINHARVSVWMLEQRRASRQRAVGSLVPIEQDQHGRRSPAVTRSHRQVIFNKATEILSSSCRTSVCWYQSATTVSPAGRAGLVGLFGGSGRLGGRAWFTILKADAPWPVSCVNSMMGVSSMELGLHSSVPDGPSTKTCAPCQAIVRGDHPGQLLRSGVPCWRTAVADGFTNNGRPSH